MLKFLWLWIAVALNDSYSSGYKIKIKGEKNLCNAMHVFILETVNFPPKFHLINIMKNVGFAHNNDLYDIVRTKKSFTYYKFWACKLFWTLYNSFAWHKLSNWNYAWNYQKMKMYAQIIFMKVSMLKMKLNSSKFKSVKSGNWIQCKCEVKGLPVPVCRWNCYTSDELSVVKNCRELAKLLWSFKGSVFK